MQLVYLYIDGYCNFQKAEFNFGQELHVHFKEDKNILEISHMDFSLPKQFWGENINNLSVVIGNNGAGKTSLMQYFIDIFLELHGGHTAGAQGIVIFGEGDQLYGYHSRYYKGEVPGISAKANVIGCVRWLGQEDVESILGRTKLIYLTNVLSVRDTRRSLWFEGNRYAPFYDCSMGHLITSSIERDVNRNLRKGPAGDSETETYFFYEQYKQIKFVFDKCQHQLCRELEEEGFPVPVPKILYVDLIMENQLSSVWDSVEFDFAQSGGIEKRLFHNLYTQVDYEEDPYVFLWKQLSRCAIWCAIRSAVRLMSGSEKEKFEKYLREDEWKEEPESYCEIFESIWRIIELVKAGRRGYENKKAKIRNENWNILRECYHCYIEFLQYINPQLVEAHFRIDAEEWDILKRHPEKGVLTFTVSTDEAEWFIEFLQKYRYICNPDYFLDFHWGVSSGENSLLSLFASFYYIFDADYTNGRHGDYKIMNTFETRSKRVKKVQCDSVILLIDEADLTYHPEWQRVFIALLTAFLPKIYPPRCCRDIQIVLSTHSPILLSDVPQQNVVYLKYDPKKGCTLADSSVHTGTFGQNIHLLFKDSFFLEKGTVGLFAEKKMKGLVNKLKEIETEIERKKGRQKEGESGRKESEPAMYGWERMEQNGQGNAESSMEALKNRLTYECRPYAELIAEPIIRRKVLMWIDTLEQKLSRRNRDELLEEMTEAEIARELVRLQKEMDRRRHD